MRRWTYAGTLLLATATILAPPAWCQDRCELTDTILTCWHRYNPTDEDPRKKQVETAAAEKLVATAAADQANAVAAQSTGIDTEGLNLSTTTRNFIPLLSFAGLLNESKEGQSSGTIAFDVNLPFLNTQQRRNLQLRLLVDTDPAVSEAVNMALPEEARDELAEKLKSELSDVDNYTVSLSYNFEGARFGRSFSLYRDKFRAFVREATGAVPQADANERADAYLSLVQRYQDMDGVKLDKPFEKWEISEGQKETARQLTEDAARAAAGLDEAFSAALKYAGLDRFGELVSNQRQLHLTAKWREREPVAGGDELSGKLTFEWSGRNLNGALAHDSCLILEVDSGPCLDSYRSYVEEHAAGIANATRVAFSAEYTSRDEQEIDLSVLELDPITIEASSKLVVSVAISRNWARTEPIGEPFRFDFEARYEDVSDDPMRQDRAVASLTVTKKIGNVSIPVGLVYANRPEFLTDVDDRISAHLGLKFDLLSGKE